MNWNPKHFKVHLVGIGGVGMRALARLLSESSLKVSGSDERDSDVLEKLRCDGISIHIGHEPSFLENVDCVVYSPAIPQTNIELVAARRRDKALLSRAEALVRLLNRRDVICVAGSHGKTTTAAMIATILEYIGTDPGYMIGGIAPSLSGRNAKVGSGPFVLEACEAFGALHHWKPGHCVITNVDDEHAEHYGGVEGLQRAFRGLIGRVPENGSRVVCCDDEYLSQVSKDLTHQCTSYGLGSSNIFSVDSITAGGSNQTFRVHKRGILLGRMRLNIAGLHNVCNALGAVAFADYFGIPFDASAAALAEFSGVDRRCQFFNVDGIRILDDYAHHPREIDAALAVAKGSLGQDGKLLVAFQPQLHSRVSRLAKSFAKALSIADEIILMPVDSAGELFHAADADEILAHELSLLGRGFERYARPADVARNVSRHLKTGDVLAVLGPGDISAVGKHLVHLLEAHADAVDATTSESRSILSANTVQYGNFASLITAFSESVRLAPRAIAAECGDDAISYSDLASKSTSLAKRLLGAGLAREQVVAVYLAPSINRLVAFLAVLMAEAVYLPIDPHSPEARRRYILEDAGAKAIICDGTMENAATNVLAIDINDQAPSAVQLSELTVPNGSAAAYVIYTSGTTGSPKGVIVEHFSLINVALACMAEFGVTYTSRLSQLSAVGFDVAIGEMSIALSAGACLVIPNDESCKTGAPLGRFVRASRVTHLSLTPSALSTLPEWEYPSLSHVIVAGERCPQDLAERWCRNHSFFNAYGPTEGTIFCSVERVLPDRPIGIGVPLANCAMIIVDSSGTPIPVGVTGDLWISGAGLARGYLNKPELTAGRFKSVCINGKRVRVYLTGDRAMIVDGRAHFKGRSDKQLKLRGFRLEPEEIEGTLRRHPQVRDAVIDIRKDHASIERLVAYVVPEGDRSLQSDVLHKFLASWLPDYMMPSRIVCVPCLPLNSNAKVDRDLLPNPFETCSARNPYQQPRTETEKAILVLLISAYPCEINIGIRDTFVGIGMDSLQTANLFLAAEEHFKVELPAAAFSKANTIELLAAYIDRTVLRSSSDGRSFQSLSDGIVHKQRGFLVNWTGLSVGPDSLIRVHNKDGGLPPLFWCCQGSNECEALAASLGTSRPVYGMRSGHLVFRYTPANIEALAVRYADELTVLRPQGDFSLGGNCQAALIAQAVASQLASRGRTVSILFLIGLARISAYQGRVVLIYNDESRINPIRTLKDPYSLFNAAYGKSYEVAILPGSGEEYFAPASVSTLGALLQQYLAGDSASM